jgi:hypothetical protein
MPLPLDWFATLRRVQRPIHKPKQQLKGACGSRSMVRQNSAAKPTAI